MSNAFGYRPDIDGLRAIAIMAVVLFHAELPFIEGGFAGVDVFFVISGFLIASILMRDISLQRFSLLTFWERRVRRLIPALTLVVLCTALGAYFVILFPADVTDFGASIAALSVFVANIFFMREGGYFAAPAETMPLLHTWTLSVEEQFYILFPLLLAGIVIGLRRSLLPTLALIAAASFAYNIYLTMINPGGTFELPVLPSLWGGADNATAAFYFLFARAWELALGAMLALSSIAIRSPFRAELLGATGLVAIISSFFLITDDTPFPGVMALLPTLGTVAILLAHVHVPTRVGQLLSTRLMVGIGLISYSLYLWHWPLLVLSDFAIAGPRPALITAGAIGLAVLLSWLTYRYVETPFRTKRYLPRQKHVFLAGGTALGVLFLIGSAVALSDGLTYRNPPGIHELLAAANDKPPRYAECYAQRKAAHYREDGACTLGSTHPDTPYSFVLWGDSHGASYMTIVDELAQRAGVKGKLFLSPGCIPIAGVFRLPKNEECQTIKNLAHAFIEDRDIKHIVLASRWSVNIQGRPSGELDSLIFDDKAQPRSVENAQDVFARRGTEQLEAFVAQGRQIYIVRQVPLHPALDVREAIAAGALRVPNLTRQEHNSYHALVNKVFDQWERRFQSVHTLDPAEVLCKTGRCVVMRDGAILYRDDDHVNESGAQRLKTLFLEKLPFLQ